MARTALAFVLFVLLLAGCGSDGNSSGGTRTPTNECEPVSGATLVKKLSPATPDRETMFLTDVEVEVEDCVERVTFKFEERAPGPGYEVSYQPADVATKQDGSGMPIAIDGENFLVVRMFPVMTAEIDGEDVKPTYEGPRNIPLPGGVNMIQQVAQTGDFEAQVTWAIGLDNKHSFTVTASNEDLIVEIGS